MKLIIGKTAGFCFGVTNAVEQTKKVLSNEKDVYCLGEIVHNRQVTEKLKKLGVQFIDNIKEAKGKTIIRSHGASKEVYEEAKKLRIELIDLTCPKVLKIHQIVEKYSKEGYYIFLLGERKHAETIGTKSFCGKYYSIIENEQELEQALVKFHESKLRKILLISQTTYSLEKFQDIEKILKENDDLLEIESINTICQATKTRQIETEDIAKNVDMMIIIGGKNSSNTQKLYNISKKICKEVVQIETKEELNVRFISKFNKVGIMAGASTPKKSIQEVVEFLEKMC